MPSSTWSSGYDLALREGRSDLPGLIARPLGPNRIVLCASPAYLAAHPTPVSREPSPNISG